MLFQTLGQQLGLAILIGVCGFALWRGGRVERLGAAAMIAAWVASPFAQLLGERSGPQYGLFAVDLALLAVLVALALRSDRWWPLWAAAFHALGTVTHLAIALDQKVWTPAYITANIIFSYLSIAALLWGAIGYDRRRRAASGA